MGLMDKAPGKPLCKKCGGKTIAVIDPEDMTTKRACIDCEVKLVEPPDRHPYAVPL